ncbi:hypothetical protein LF908_07940 [Bifidobacterium pseudolongum]|uniref:hypothetical protein n=1 Tax=Bifidobacterium pseudolongum TaxID=1694 RepID=UPI001F0E53E3|nr:hypothetical protein [Bifidobacterium pseudolongum]MCH4852130.1 hypothetical protein [Bifidobacterium pseudolongum]
MGIFAISDAINLWAFEKADYFKELNGETHGVTGHYIAQPQTTMNISRVFAGWLWRAPVGRVSISRCRSRGNITLYARWNRIVFADVRQQRQPDSAHLRGCKPLDGSRVALLEAESKRMVPISSVA